MANEEGSKYNPTNSDENYICMSVIKKTASHPLAATHIHPQTSLRFPIQYSHPYHQYLSQFAPTFVPYYHRLLSRPIVKLEEMDIENYINCEVAAQRTTLMRKTVLRPLGQHQPLLDTKTDHTSQKMVSKQTNVMTGCEPPAGRRIVNAKLMAMTTACGSIRNMQTSIEPLPAVEDSFRQQVGKIQKSQHHYEQLFGRLTTMLQTLNQRYDKDCEEVPAPPSKRPRHISTSSAESHLQDTTADHERENLVAYPQRVKNGDGSYVYVLGPNGTEISAHQYGEVFWTSAPVATRSLLGVVFSSDELATHTLTGKPSPAFYGRERPPKLQLNQQKVDDIVLCVVNRTGGKERVIRATITTKCADTAKKYKRRAKKALKIKEEPF
ncbi:early boundary activity protein 2 [Drosophila obscura]|uniref:early boundary activity protein 2 n=1 Tax=Drosophila obscura TaxID=7282 RepID=UPI001BB103BD|nr:early boundary activity protein 2 [Drosophila obscura]